MGQSQERPAAADIAEVCFLAAMPEALSRRVVGWAISRQLTATAPILDSTSPSFFNRFQGFAHSKTTRTSEEWP